MASRNPGCISEPTDGPWPVNPVMVPRLRGQAWVPGLRVRAPRGGMNAPGGGGGVCTP